ncbi:MAG: DUF4262 domain-containing protein [Hyphomicrobiaceae bacterium]|nr:DUF4262 domain-containing protein [Hyphomicrobiaceae bacterium]
MDAAATRGRRRPALIIFGLSRNVMHGVCHDDVNLVRGGKFAAPKGDISGILEDDTVRIIDVDTSLPDVFGAYLIWTHGYYGRRNFPVRQLVWPSREGRYPRQRPSTDGLRCRQPVLRNMPMLP